MKIELPFKTPTINHLYGQRGFRKYLKPEAKKLREEIAMLIPKQDDWMSDDTKLSITVDIYEDWFTKTGTIKKKDIGNREKFLVDSIFNVLNMDDKQIFEQRMRKIQSNEEKAVIEIKQYKTEE
jgi:Holliday junction resolvase RusA-like endonuclease